MSSLSINICYHQGVIGEDAARGEGLVVTDVHPIVHIGG